MNSTRRILVNILATAAFLFLFLLPVLGFSATKAEAGETVQGITSTGDYIFFIVENDEVPLAATPTQNVSGYFLWISVACFASIVVFVYSAWYLSIRRNIRELTGKLSTVERREFKLASGFFHPIRSYQLAKEAEDSVASMYIGYI